LRLLLIFSLAFLLNIGCASTPPLQSDFTNTQASGKQRAKFRSQKGNAHSIASRRTSGKNSRRPLTLAAKKNRSRRGGYPPSANRKILLPTVSNAKDRTLMVLVNSGANRMSLLDLPRGTLRSEQPVSGSVPPTAFYLDQLEITVGQYKVFDDKYDETPFTEGRSCPNCPAMGIDWTHANRYCQWAGKRLPTEVEWVTAASGESGNLWPWGNEFSPERANLLGHEDGSFSVAPVGSYPQGASPYGLLDMTGNVWEWVSTPYAPSGGGPETTPLRIVKGGGWTSDKKSARISFKNVVYQAMKNPTIGFRCAKSI
jgi:formylglycine-generating enzyme required for sulfatase activity